MKGAIAVWRAPYAWPFLILLALNVLVFVSFTFWRGYQERRLSVEAVTLREAIAQQRKAAADVGRQIELINANIAETKRFYTEVVKDRGQLSETLTRLVDMARDLGIRTPMLSVGRRDVKGTLLTVFEITMPVSGTYQQLGALLQKLERSDDFVIVRSVAMHGRSADGGADLDIRLEAYFSTSADKGAPK
jgi:hypothetical protein